MAFELDLMALNSGGFGLPPRFFSYGITSDTLATVILDDYFLEYGENLRVGDFIFVTSDAVSPLPAGILVVQTIVVVDDEITSVTVSQLV